MRSNSGVIDFWSQSDTTNKSNKSSPVEGKKTWRVSSDKDHWRKEVLFLLGPKNGGGVQKAPVAPPFPSALQIQKRNTQSKLL